MYCLLGAEGRPLGESWNGFPGHGHADTRTASKQAQSTRFLPTPREKEINMLVHYCTTNKRETEKTRHGNESIAHDAHANKTRYNLGSALIQPPP